MAFFNGTYPSRTKPSRGMRGASVDLVAKHVTLHGAAECNPSDPTKDAPFPPPTNKTWIACWGCTDQTGPNEGKFSIVFDDLSEWHGDLP